MTDGARDALDSAHAERDALQQRIDKALSDPARPTRRCPRLWPHTAHGPWRTGDITHPVDTVTYHCPGVPATRGEQE